MLPPLIKFLTALGSTRGLPGMVQLRQTLLGLTYQDDKKNKLDEYEDRIKKIEESTKLKEYEDRIKKIEEKYKL